MRRRSSPAPRRIRSPFSSSRRRRRTRDSYLRHARLARAGGVAVDAREGGRARGCVARWRPSESHDGEGLHRTPVPYYYVWYVRFALHRPGRCRNQHPFPAYRLTNSKQARTGSVFPRMAGSTWPSLWRRLRRTYHTTACTSILAERACYLRTPPRRSAGGSTCAQISSGPRNGLTSSLA